MLSRFHRILERNRQTHRTAILISHVGMLMRNKNGGSGHYFSMMRWLESYYLASRIWSAKEPVVYSKTLQNKPSALWCLPQALVPTW